MNADILSNMVITKVRVVTTLYNDKGAKGKRIDRLRWSVLVKYEGETVYHSCQKSFISDANHIIVLPNGCSYEWECTRSGHFSVIEFESDACADEPISLPTKNSDKILKMIKSLEYKRNLNTPFIEAESIRDTYSILLAAFQSAKESYLPTDKHKKIAPAIEYISQNYTKPITNHELAAISGVSTVYFRKLFTSAMGVSPIAYARELRINKAKEMLKSDYGSLTELAQSLGYPTLYDFSRDFKKHTGRAPSKF